MTINSKEHWNSYVECADSPEYIGYIEATTGIISRLDSLVQQQKTYSLSMEVFREAIEEIIIDRKELLSYASEKRGLEL